MSNNRRRVQGRVVSDKMQKTIVVEVERAKQHRLYRKVLRYTMRYMAHDEHGAAKEGDFVQIVESRPLSRRKRWALETILEAGHRPESVPSDRTN
jgi:small subunit ribosomal protein S17